MIWSLSKASILMALVLSTLSVYAVSSSHYSGITSEGEDMILEKRGGGFLKWMKGESSRGNRSAASEPETPSESDTEPESDNEGYYGGSKLASIAPVVPLEARNDPLGYFNKFIKRDIRVPHMKQVLKDEITERHRWLRENGYNDVWLNFHHVDANKARILQELSSVPFIHLKYDYSEEEIEKNALQMIVDIENWIPDPHIDVRHPSRAEKIATELGRHRFMIENRLWEYNNKPGVDKGKLFRKMMKEGRGAQIEFMNLQKEFQSLFAMAHTFYRNRGPAF